VGQDRDARKRPKGGTTVSEEERKDQDEGQEEAEDVEAHRKPHGKMTDDGGDDDENDVEAHRKPHGK